MPTASTAECGKPVVVDAAVTVADGIAVKRPGEVTAPLLDAHVFSVEVGMCKPDPGIYAEACRRLDVRPDECLYVGDTIRRGRLTSQLALRYDRAWSWAPAEGNGTTGTSRFNAAPISSHTRVT